MSEEEENYWTSLDGLAERVGMIADSITFTLTSLATVVLAKIFGDPKFNWITTGLSSVCMTCDANEQTSPYDETELPEYPAHPNCECTIEPA